MFLICSKCKGEMIEGYIPDFETRDFSSRSVWVEGKPGKSFLTGTQAFKETKINIKTFRCKNCGFLESYAINEE
jgi:predicted Zn-ribbon and HTH transcriptional regulator